MPPKNSLKEYCSNCYYHIYNRGVAKQDIFKDEQDYSVMLNYLKEYLLVKDNDQLRELLQQPSLDYHQREKTQKMISLKNYHDEISLLAFCLMPNHFHFLLKQNGERSIYNFMNSLCTRYSMYFNNKYKRVGSLFQGVYKAVTVNTDEQLVYLSYYIHRQSLKIINVNDIPASQGETLRARRWKEKYPSSFTTYLGLTNSVWINTKDVLSFFNKIRGPEFTSYESFVTNYVDTTSVSKLLIEN